MKMKNQAGSIVIFSLMMMSMMTALTQQLLKSVYVSRSFIKAMIDRERAETVALGGINVAIETLKMQFEKEESQQDEKKDDKDTDGKKGLKPFLKKVLPHLNRWQSFPLNEEVDGLDGELKICITCEHGKININEIFDFEKEDFKQEYANLLKVLEIRGKIAAGELYTKFVEFFKKRKKPLEDISELYEVQGIDTLDIFYQPPAIPQGKDKAQANPRLALQDLFTVYTDNDQLEPLMLSDSVCAVFGLRRPLANDGERLKDRFEQTVEVFDKNWGSNWNENWRFLQVLYDARPRLVQDLGTVFSKQFGPEVYSVLSSGKVGDVEQRLLAVVQRVDVASVMSPKDKSDKKKEESNDLSGESKDAQQQERYMFKVVKAYWI